MDLSPSPFWIKKHQQSSVFDFKNIPVENHTDGDSDDDTSEVIIGKNVYISLIFFCVLYNINMSAFVVNWISTFGWNFNESS